MRFSTFLAGALATVLVSAHPGDDANKERLARRAYLQGAEKRDLSHCAAKIKERGLQARNIQRRAERASALRKERGLEAGGVYGKRAEINVTTVLNTSHQATEDYTLATPEEILFSGNNSCLLSPEVILGPYYVAGEYVRENLVEEQVGVPIHLDLQVLDVATCEPVENVYAEIWQCNSTGVYSGVSADGNGNSLNETSNLDATFLRGVQKTDGLGVVEFDTLVPGHYTGRTNHIHVLVHLNATAEANGTLFDTTVSHVGQVFFDQDLLYEVEALDPYTSNTQEYTINSEDFILTDEAEGSDPVIEYVYLGETVADGVLGWLAFGINTSFTESITPAAFYYASGGETNPAYVAESL